IAMTSLAIDLGPFVMHDSVVYRQQHRFGSIDQLQHRRCQHPAHWPQAPSRFGKQAVITAGMGIDDASNRPKNPADGSPSIGYDRSNTQQHEAFETGACEGTSERLNQRLRLLRKYKHCGLLSNWMLSNYPAWSGVLSREKGKSAEVEGTFWNA